MSTSYRIYLENLLEIRGFAHFDSHGEMAYN